MGLVVTKKLGLKDGNPGVIDEKRNEIGSSERAPDVKKRKKESKLTELGLSKEEIARVKRCSPLFDGRFTPRPTERPKNFIFEDYYSTKMYVDVLHQ